MRSNIETRTAMVKYVDEDSYIEPNESLIDKQSLIWNM